MLKVARVFTIVSFFSNIFVIVTRKNVIVILELLVLSIVCSLIVFLFLILVEITGGLT